MSAYHCINIEFNHILPLVENLVFVLITMKSKGCLASFYS